MLQRFRCELALPPLSDGRRRSWNLPHSRLQVTHNVRTMLECTRT